MNAKDEYEGQQIPELAQIQHILLNTVSVALKTRDFPTQYSALGFDKSEIKDNHAIWRVQYNFIISKVKLIVNERISGVGQKFGLKK